MTLNPTLARPPSFQLVSEHKVQEMRGKLPKGAPNPSRIRTSDKVQWKTNPIEPKGRFGCGVNQVTMSKDGTATASW
jgi:hypothetical protein